MNLLTTKEYKLYSNFLKTLARSNELDFLKL